MSSSLSDLELVAQAMGSTTPAKQTETVNGQLSSTQAITSPQAPPTSTETNSSPLEHLDLSTLTAADRKTLQPIIDALQASSISLSTNGSGDNGDGEDGKEAEDMEDERIQDLLRQMDIAGDVADEIEGKLDRLLAELGGLGEEIEDGIKVKGSEGDKREGAGTR